MFNFLQEINLEKFNDIFINNGYNTRDKILNGKQNFIYNIYRGK